MGASFLTCFPEPLFFRHYRKYIFNLEQPVIIPKKAKSLEVASVHLFYDYFAVCDLVISSKVYHFNWLFVIK